MRFAVIDIGTVTCRLFVADLDDGVVTGLCRQCEIVNLGEGVDATNMLDQAAINRTCAVVEGYLRVVEKYSSEGPVEVRCIATSASRDASNADELAARLHELGVSVSVIDGVTEARLSFLGVSSSFAGQRLLVSDIGGGSTELMYGVAGERVRFARSFDVGCRRGTERFLSDDPPTPSQLDELAHWASDEFAPFFEEMVADGFVPERYVAVAGVPTSAVAIDKALVPYDPKAVHGQEMSAHALEGIYSRLSSMTCAEREHVAGLHPKRAPVIVAGLAILRQVLSLSGLQGFTASESDILEGVVLDTFRVQH